MSNARLVLSALLLQLCTAAESRAQVVVGWTRVFDAGGSDRALDVHVRPDRSLLVLAEAHSASQGQESLVLAYSSAGGLLWTREIHGGVGHNSGYSALATTADGGGFVVRATSQVLETHRVASGGALVWSRSHALAAGAQAFAPAVAVGADGFVNVVYSDAGDYLVLRYSPGGVAMGTHGRWRRSPTMPRVTCRGVRRSTALPVRSIALLMSRSTSSGTCSSPARPRVPATTRIR